MKPAAGYVIAVLTAWVCLCTGMFLGAFGNAPDYKAPHDLVFGTLFSIFIFPIMLLFIFIPFISAYLLARRLNTTALIFHLFSGVLISLLFAAWWSIGKDLEVVGGRLVHVTYLHTLLRYIPPFGAAGLAGSATYWLVSGRFGTHLPAADETRL